MGNLIFLFTSTLIVGLLATIFLNFLARSRQWLSRGPVSLVGGLSIAVSLIWGGGSGLYLFEFDFSRIGVLAAGGGILFFFGWADDVKEASVVLKFLWQFVCAIGMVLLGFRTNIVFLGELGNFLFSVLWVVGLTNAFNLLDVSDGICVGSAICASIGLAFLAFFSGNIETFGLLLVLCASLISVFIFNFPPAKIYLGNAGSHFLGFILSLAGIMLFSDKSSLGMYSAVFIVMWLPLLETISLIGFRMTKGLNPFCKSNDHLVLRLKAKGMSDRKALDLLIVVALIFSIIGVGLYYFFSFMVLILALVLVSIISGWVLALTISRE